MFVFLIKVQFVEICILWMNNNAMSIQPKVVKLVSRGYAMRQRRELKIIQSFLKHQGCCNRQAFFCSRFSFLSCDFWRAIRNTNLDQDKIVE